MTGQLTIDALPGVTRSAVISADGTYRYRLDRRWGAGPTVAWVMLNPSTADADDEDATTRRCAAFSRNWGFGALSVVNLYALRATNPAELWRAKDPVGPENDRYIAEALTGVAVVAAWGAHARPGRISEVLALHAAAPGAGRLHALAVTASGQPGHPLYLRASLTPAPWALTGASMHEALAQTPWGPSGAVHNQPPDQRENTEPDVS